MSVATNVRASLLATAHGPQGNGSVHAGTAQSDLERSGGLAALERAWLDSAPGGSGGHEEGGFVTTDANGNLEVVRWLKGERDSMRVPPHPNCEVGDRRIVATFHTHPNTGDDYLQEPSETDKRAVRDDRDLKGADYVGEFVISCEIIFLITPAGRVREVAETRELFAG